MNFNKERFANFAKYDLTINKAFYRNIALATIAGAISVALIGFMARYSIYTNLQPVVASLVAIAIGQDVLTWDKPVAGILVLASAYIVTVVASKEGKREK